MLALLLLTISLLLLISYILNHKYIISPTFILLSSYFICVLVAFINQNYWKRDISFLTLIVIVTSLLSFFFGDFLGRSTNNSTQINTEVKNELKILGNGTILILCVFAIIIFFMELNYVFRVAQLSGWSFNYLSMFENARTIMNTRLNIIQKNPIHEYGLIIVQSAAYYCVYLFIAHTINNGFKKENIKYLLEPFIYLGISVISTSRNFIINLMIYIFMLFFFLSRRKFGTDKRLRKKIIKYAIVIVISIIAGFRLLGVLTGKSNINLWDNLSTYTGASIIAFDIWMGNITKSKIWGQYIFVGIFNVLRILGFNIPSYSVNAEQVVWANAATNIYTGMRYYIQDFTFAGNFAIQFILGILYGTFFNKIVSGRMKSIGIVIYCMLFYVVPYGPIAERFFSTVITPTTFVGIIFVIFMDKYIAVYVKNNNRKIIKNE